MFEFSSWNHIRKGEPISLSPRLFATSPGEGPNLSNYLFCCDHHLWPCICLISSPSCSSHHFENLLLVHLPPCAISHSTPCSSSRTGIISVRQDRFTLLHDTLTSLEGSSSLAPTLITSSDQLNTVLARLHWLQFTKRLQYPVTILGLTLGTIPRTTPA